MDLNSKYLNYITGLGLILWYIGLGLEKYLDYLTGFGQSYDALGLDLKITWTTLLDSNKFYLQSW